MIYFDTSYIVRLYFADPGYDSVRELAATDEIACCLFGRVEVVAALHRKFREKALSPSEHRVVVEEFEKDCAAGAFRWLSLSAAVIDRVSQIYAQLPASVFLRAADAMHLACAAENGVREVYSNDTHLLSAAAHFGLRGSDVI